MKRVFYTIFILIGAVVISQAGGWASVGAYSLGMASSSAVLLPDTPSNSESARCVTLRDSFDSSPSLGGVVGSGAYFNQEQLGLSYDFYNALVYGSGVNWSGFTGRVYVTWFRNWTGVCDDIMDVEIYDLVNGVGVFSSDSYVTRIDSIVPVGVIATSTSVSIGASGYVNSDDVTLDNGSSDVYLQQELSQDSRQACQATGVWALEQCTHSQASVTWSHALLDGSFNESTTTPILQIGNYTLETKIKRERWWWFDETLVSTSTWFTASTTNNYDDVTGRRENASSTAPLVISEPDRDSCKPYSANFNMANCILALFLPTNGYVAGFASHIYFSIMERFPMGYVNDFVAVLTASSTQPLVALHAVVPPTLPGAGAEMTLSLDHSFDSMLNATSGVFLSGEATSTETFYEITSYYWRIVLYVLAGFYIARRLLGSHLIRYSHVN